MIRIELARKLAHEQGTTLKVAEDFINSFLEEIAQTLENGEKVQLAGFGVFDIRYVPEHKGRNPKTGEVLTVPACYYPIFRAGKGLKDRVAKVQKVEDPGTTFTKTESTTVIPKPTRKKKSNPAS